MNRRDADAARRLGAQAEGYRNRSKIDLHQILRWDRTTTAMVRRIFGVHSNEALEVGHLSQKLYDGTYDADEVAARNYLNQMYVLLMGFADKLSSPFKESDSTLQSEGLNGSVFLIHGRDPRGVWLSYWTNRHECAKTDCQIVT